MNSFFRGLICAGLIASASAGALWAADTADSPEKAPDWISYVPALDSGGERAFSFRINIDTPMFRTICYASWAPPDRRAIVFCDPSDGLPLMVSIDGDAWIYDLAGGQIAHFKAEPDLRMRVNGRALDFRFGMARAGQATGIHVDLGSLLDPSNMTAWKSTNDATSRTTEARTQQDGKVILVVSATDPPLPKRCAISPNWKDATVRIECDAFQFGGRLPAWHHPFDLEKLMKDVPYLDAAEVKGDFKDGDQEKMAADLLFGEATFLIRPALNDPAIRKKLEEMKKKIDFKQIELHEKLLKGAWLKALEHQQFDPAKGMPPLK